MNITHATITVHHVRYEHGRAVQCVSEVDAELRDDGKRVRAFVRHPTGPWLWELAEGQWEHKRN